MAQLETLEAKVNVFIDIIQIVLILFIDTLLMNLNLPRIVTKLNFEIYYIGRNSCVLCFCVHIILQYVQFYLSRFNLFYIKIPFYSTHMNIRFNLCIFWNFYNNTSVHIIYSRIIARLHFQNQFNFVFRSCCFPQDTKTICWSITHL